MSVLLRKPHVIAQSRGVATVAAPRPVFRLSSVIVSEFRHYAFEANTPALLPRHALRSIPAIRRWFIRQDKKTSMNIPYLSKFGANMVPLEFSDGQNFTRMQQPLSLFLEILTAQDSQYMEAVPEPDRFFSAHHPGARVVRRAKTTNTFFFPTAVPKTQIYLAQAPIADLTKALRDDLPTPELVRKAGKGDVYDSSIWIGRPPTYTPLHKDPNPNLFVQLAGDKVIRLFSPEYGRGVFAKVQEAIGANASESMRGEEMMKGVERAALMEEVWGDNSEHVSAAYEARLGKGDAVFIPKGWWHSVKSVGDEMNGSVSL